MNIPNSEYLPIDKLTSVFNNTTNSYKYFWLLSILEFIKYNSDKTILVEDLIFEMISNVWYPINYFKLSFGKQDKFAEKIENIKNKYLLSESISKNDLINFLQNKKREKIVQSLISDLKRYVPYRFLTPWFNSNLRGIKDHLKNKLIIDLCKKYFDAVTIKPLYKFSSENNCIIITEDWHEYLSKHLMILQGFTYWHLIEYLQKNNPNVPNIHDKLFPPIQRDLSTAKRFYYTLLRYNKTMRCIYSNQVLNLENIAIDHYLPWSFVAHDQLWNLIPTLKIINSAKSNNIPSEKYLEKFASFQFEAFQFANKNNYVQKKLLEDYTILFDDTINNISNFSKSIFTEIIKGNIKPLMQIATNMGYQGNWVYINDL